MSLRVRLVLLLAAILALLMGAEWLLVRSLTRDLSAELGEVASSVGRQVVSRVEALDLPGKSGFAFSLENSAGPDSPENQVQPIVALPSETVVSQETRILKAPGSGEHQTSVRITTVHVEGNAVSGSGDKTLGKPRFLVLKGPHVRSLIPIPEKAFAETVTRFRGQLLLGSLALLGVGLLSAAVVADRVSAPLRELARTARTVGEGGLGAQVVTSRAPGGEAGEAIVAFNRMSLRLKELERETLALKERKHLGELGDVARGLAHALRNPLHAIGLSLEELAGRAERFDREGDADQDVGGDASVEASVSDSSSELAESARRQIRHIDQSIRAFLALANGGGGAEESLDGTQLVKDVVLTALHDARGRVHVEIQEPQSPIRIQGIAAEVKAVLQALVVNAIEASPNGASVAVRVAPAEGVQGLRVELEDRGTGLPPEVRERLFTPHVTTKANGSGMGLFLAHRIATGRYAGSLELAGASPCGTRAVLVLRDRTGAADV
ncbi:MAG TPA: HAMP domain-containing sensor histidine kinase [Thermoanaerobaculia bacterium]